MQKFQRLFFSEKDYIDCITALTKVTPPIIRIEDDKKYYLLGERSKGAIVAWFNVIGELRGKLKVQEINTFIELVNKEISGLNIGTGGRSFQSKTSSYKKYIKQLTALIN